jgi:hypothetical protein
MTRRRRWIYALASFLFLVALIEVPLRVIDPWGAWRYFSEFTSVPLRADPRGYGYPPGVYTFPAWSATMLLDGNRYVPETNTHAACTVALVGDSVTFGYGVNDAETWANLVARELPDVHIINTGLPAANVWNAAKAIQHIRADGYFYLLIGNDHQAAPDWQTKTKWTPASAIEVYLYTWYFAEGLPYVPVPGFEDVVREIASNPKVMIVAFDTPGLGREMAAKYPVALVPHYTKRISRADAHATAQGNWQIAEAVMPHLRALVGKVCSR